MTPNRFKVVIDTNVLLVSISPFSKYHWIFEELQNETYELFITNDILLEYDEITSLKYSDQVVINLFETLKILPNVHQVIPHFKWNLISQDPDDNKFVDCAITAGADFILTHDKHFNVLKEIEFPKIRICKIPEFKDMIYRQNQN
jgi:putative PIN family toxin of toxin-antitoxin system